MCHIPAHGDSCAEHKIVPCRRGDTLVLLQRLAEAPLPTEEAVGSPALLPAWRPRARPAHSPLTQGRRTQPSSTLLVDISVTALLRRLRGWAGELTINPGKIASLLLVPRRHCGRYLWSQQRRLVLAWGCSWQGIWEVPLRQGSKHLPGTELDRSRSQDFAFQLSIGNRVFLLFQVFIKIHNY